MASADTEKMKIEHVVPQVGLTEITLYPPATVIFEKLRACRENSRLSKMRHLGALSFALPGARLTRWDYTVALLHYTDRLNLKGFSSKFKIGEIEFSSTKSALQCAALIWNIGHIPGTFAVEKGVYQYLHQLDPANPALNLPWNLRTSASVERIIEESDKALHLNDYNSTSRVLACIKLLSLCESEDCFLFKFTRDFAAPLLLNYKTDHSKQWEKIKPAFNLARHIAYLTVDIPFSGHRWTPNIPDLLESYIKIENQNLDTVQNKVSEILSPLEKRIYDTVYHTHRARRESAIYSAATKVHLESSLDHEQTISQWLGLSSIKSLRLTNKARRNAVSTHARITLRSHFSAPSEKPVTIEKKLRDLGFTHASVFEYKPWNSNITLEPDEITLDFSTTENYNHHLGRTLSWFISNFDTKNSPPNDYFELTNKSTLEDGYSQILNTALQKIFPDTTVKLDTWPLVRFGLFREHGLSPGSGCIWAAEAMLSDQISKHLFRDKSRTISPELKEQYCELLGIKALRDVLRNRWSGRRVRCRWLIITSSIKIQRENRSIMEFDGGLLQVSTRSGKLTWFGLESKSGNENPQRSLNKRLRAIGLTYSAEPINKNYAYVEIPIP